MNTITIYLGIKGLKIIQTAGCCLKLLLASYLISQNAKKELNKVNYIYTNEQELCS